MEKEKLNSITNSISNVFEKLLDWIVTLFFCVLIISCVTQVFMRTVVNISPPWTEELARYSFMYVNILAAAICVRKKSHARVSIITDAVGPKVRQALEIFSDLVIIFAAYVMVRYGIKCVLQVAIQKSPAMRLNMSFVYACVPIAGIVIAFESIFNLLKDIGVFAKEEKE